MENELQNYRKTVELQNKAFLDALTGADNVRSETAENSLPPNFWWYVLAGGIAGKLIFGRNGTGAVTSIVGTVFKNVFPIVLPVILKSFFKSENHG